MRTLKKKKGPFCITKAFLQHMLTHCLKKIIINIHGFGGRGAGSGHGVPLQDPPAVLQHDARAAVVVVVQHHALPVALAVLPHGLGQNLVQEGCPLLKTKYHQHIKAEAFSRPSSMKGVHF